MRRFALFDTLGGALVEMAVTLPLILLLMTGIFSVSTALYQKLQLTQAVGAAGRLLAVDRGSTTPCEDAVSAVKNASPGLTRSNLTITVTVNGATCSDETGLTSGDSAVVAATYPTGLAIYGQNYVTVNLGSQITEAVQ